MDQRAEFNKALCAFQAERQMIGETSINTHTKRRYASYSDFVLAIKESLSRHGLSINHSTKFENGIEIMVTTLRHNSGYQETSEFPLYVSDRNNQQQWGSARTYCKKYALREMLGLVSGESEDDDGESTVRSNNAAPATQLKGCINEKQLGLLRYKLQGDKEHEQAILKSLKITDLKYIPFNRFNEVLESCDFQEEQ